jgi:hypothetical protein
MGFWEGMVQGFKDGETQRNVETARNDRKAETAKADARYDSETEFRKTQWENTLSEQKRRRRLEDDALTQASEDRLHANRIESLKLGGTVPFDVNKPPSGEGGDDNTPVNSRQSFETSVATLSHFGADQETIAGLAGYGSSVLESVIEGYNKAVEEAKDISGVAKPNINEFIGNTTFITAKGERPTPELMQERMNMTLEELRTPMFEGTGVTWEDRFTSLYGTDDRVTAILPGGVTEGLDIAGITAVTGQIKDATAPFIESTISDNRAKMDSPDISEDDKAALATRNVELGRALEALEGGNATKAFNELGPDAANLVLGFMANKPGSERSNFGPPYDAIIESRTFEDDKEGSSDYKIAALANSGELKEGDWVFQDGSFKEYAGLPEFETEAQAGNWSLENPELSAATPFAKIGGVLTYNQVALEGPSEPTDGAPVEDTSGTMVPPTQDSLPEGLGGGMDGAPNMDRPEKLPFTPTGSYPDIQGVTNQTEFWARNPTKNDGKDQWNEDAPNTPAPDASPEMEQQEGQLLADMIMDEDVPGPMKDKATEKFIMKYGVSAMRDVQELLY